MNVVFSPPTQKLCTDDLHKTMSDAIILYLTEMTQAHYELQEMLQRDNFEVQQRRPSPGFFDDSIERQPSLVLLDCRGQGVQELTICREIRKIYPGLLVLISNEANVQFNILALNLGADASFTLSQGVPLIAASVKALLRRFANVSRQLLLTFDNLIIDATRREITVEKRKVNLSSVEFEVIWLLARKSGTVVTRSEIYKELYKETYNGYDRNIDLYVSRIRKKIGDDPGNPMYLKTVRGIGYQFVCSETIGSKVTP